jgi:hypothetical protein
MLRQQLNCCLNIEDAVSELPYLLFQPLYWVEMPPKSREDRGFLIQISCILHGFMDGNAWD